MPQINNPLVTPIYRSYAKLLAICVNASLSAFFVGYSLVYMGSISVKDFQSAIKDDYLFQWDLDLDTLKSIIQGALPIGAIIGALLSSQVIRFFSRRLGFLVTNIPAFISIILMVYIRNPYTFIAMRVIQGICTGIFSAIVPLYINQIVTPDCTNLGSLNQIFIAFAQFFCFLLAFILDLIFESDSNDNASTRWKIIAEFPLLILALQSLIFIFVFPFETPKYLYEKGQRQKAADLIAILYRQQHTDDALARYMRTPSVSEEQSQIAIRSQLIGVENPIQRIQNSKFAIFFAIHLALLQQMSGVNAIAVYGKNTLEDAIGNDIRTVGIATLALTGGPVLSAIATIKLMNIKGRTLVCCICLGAVGTAFMLKQQKSYQDSKFESITIIAGMCIFMTIFGLTLGPIVWLYIPQIIQPNIIPFSTMTNLLGAALCMITFPLIPHKQIPFIFFFCWCLVSLFINQRLMVETRNKSRQRIFEEYKNKKLC